jgi:hypothetical protein
MDHAEDRVPMAGEIFEETGVSAWNAGVTVGEEEDGKFLTSGSRRRIQFGMCPNTLERVEGRFGNAEERRECPDFRKSLA